MLATHLLRQTQDSPFLSAAVRCETVEDYTSKYKGEQVELALFGGDYQEGVLTAYCYVDEVAHIELNGHILVPCRTSPRSTARAAATRRRTTTGLPVGCSTTKARTAAAPAPPDRRAEHPEGVAPADRDHRRACAARLGRRRRAVAEIFVFSALLSSAARIRRSTASFSAWCARASCHSPRRHCCTRRSSASPRAPAF